MPLDDFARERSQQQLTVCVLRNVGAEDISTSTAFGPFEPGDQITIVVHGDAFAAIGADDVTADNTGTPIPAGVSHWTWPDEGEGTHLALFAESAVAGAAWASGH